MCGPAERTTPPCWSPCRPVFPATTRGFTAITWLRTPSMPSRPPPSRFASTKPKPATLAKEGWHKEAAKRKLFLFDPRQSGEEMLLIYSLSSRLVWEWDGDGPGLTVPNAYVASGLLALPVTSTPLFVAHEDPLLELPSDCPCDVNHHTHVQHNKRSIVAHWRGL